ncbi:hypothetical protein RvY_10200 [Ramazzottius varieornatus]|uniref:Uncharacterized protein n=1 Tax=Ramazzottius varieornatus TaxID=947166 RepID=A0A1D1VGH6_RAMVA|nr:hypothetical protein RvY_10200 [Ramazzottius varieornatus]
MNFPFNVFGGMGGSYPPYQLPGLTAGFLMGIPMGSPFGFPLGPSMGMPLLQPLAQPRFKANEWLALQVIVALTDAAVVVGVVMALDGVVDVADVAAAHNDEMTLNVVDTREVDVMVADNGEAAPVTLEEDGRRMTTKTPIRQARRIRLPLALPSSEDEPKLAMRTLATESKDPATNIDQLEHQTGNDEASRTWTQDTDE